MRISTNFRSVAMPLALAGVAMLGLAAAPAGASIIPFLQSENSPSAGTYDYVYQARLSADQAVGDGASLTISGVPSGVSLLAGSETGFLTGWVATDSGASITFTDDNSGPLVDGPLTAQFTVVSDIGPNNTTGTYSATAFKNTPGAPDNGTPTYNGGEVAVPAPSSVPEPASLALLGLGLGALGLARRKRA